MKATGTTRKIDDLGRLVIPIEVRRNLDMNIGDPVEFFVQGRQVVIQKYERGCIFCGEAGNVTYIKDKPVCQGCLKMMKGMK